MKFHQPFLVAIYLLLLGTKCFSQELQVQVDAQAKLHRLSKFLTGACIEDVNHEIYGGIYSQMIFGESFQEPSLHSPIEGFEVVGGAWYVENGVLYGGDGDGPKLVSNIATPAQGDVSVEILLPGERTGNGALLLSTSDARVGADNFSGYEIALDHGAGGLLVGRHQHDFKALSFVECEVPRDEWIKLRVHLEHDRFVVFVNNKELVTIHDDSPLAAGSIGLRQWQRPAQYRNLTFNESGKNQSIEFQPSVSQRHISGMWDAFEKGTAIGAYELTKLHPFVGTQSQKMSYIGGTGVVGIANRGLNRWGLAFAAQQPYECLLWLRSSKETKLNVALENNDGSDQLARESVAVEADGEWRQYALTLTPRESTESGRISLLLETPGEVDVGYVLLQPGEWGRYKNLALRRDVVEGLISQGVTVLRYGGSMVDNPPNYRWKNMIGPRDRRQPYDGHWYDYSTNGWGILDFLDLCDAAGFLGVPCFSIDESPADMIDFIEYANGTSTSPWGGKRVQDGRAVPYNLRHIQLGNEESVNADYWRRFEPIAREIWSRDAGIVLVVGDFQYEQPITDPSHLSGSLGGNTSLETHEKILRLAKEYDAEVWFDTHMWTAGPDPTASMNSFFSFVDAIDKLADGAKHHVVVFEFNSDNHRLHRALSNAEMLGRIMRDGRVPVALSANCLQPDGQNDNGWDQGLLFLNNSKIWYQPPGYITQMVSRAYQPWVIACKARVATSDNLSAAVDVVATAAEDASKVVLLIVNRNSQRLSLVADFNGLKGSHHTASIVTMAGPLDAVNTAESPVQIAPREAQVRWDRTTEPLQLEIEPYSYSTITIADQP